MIIIVLGEGDTGEDIVPMKQEQDSIKRNLVKEQKRAFRN